MTSRSTSLPDASSVALTPTTSAPAAASAMATASPRPRRAPVTTAVLPSSLKGSPFISVRPSPELLHRDGVHVGEGLVFAAHSPAERVAAGARARVDRPRRRDDRL